MCPSDPDYSGYSWNFEIYYRKDQSHRVVLGDNDDPEAVAAVEEEVRLQAETAENLQADYAATGAAAPGDDGEDSPYELLDPPSGEEPDDPPLRHHAGGSPAARGSHGGRGSQAGRGSRGG